MEGVRKRHSNLNSNETVEDDDEFEPLIKSSDGRRPHNLNNTNDRDYDRDEDRQNSIVAVSFYDSLLSVVSYFWKSMYESFGWPLPIDEDTKLSLMKLKNILSEPFDNKNETHMLSLKQLWDVGFKGENLDYQLISDDWKKLGFQSDDPMRDFRGTGIFGVEQLLFFAEKCPQKFHYILDLNHEREGERYPIVVASFNVTMMLFELLGWGWKTKNVSSCTNQNCYYQMVKMIAPNPETDIAQSKFALNVMFCVAMILLDAKWDQMAASYMDFPNVIKATQKEYEDIFGSESRTLTDLLILVEEL